MLLDPYATNSPGSPRSCYFDGKTRLDNSCSNITPVFPSSSSFGLASYWYNRTVQTGDVSTVFSISTSAGKTVACVSHQTINSQRVLRVTLSDDGFVNWMDCVGSTTLPNDSNWHHVIIFWDTNTTSISYYVDGSPGAFATTSHSGSTFNITYTGKTFSVGASDAINDTAYLNSGLAEFFFMTPTATVNLATDVALFIDTTNAVSQYLGTNGMVPYGSPPQIYLFGNKSFFSLNLTNYTRFPLILDLTGTPGPNVFQVTGAILNGTDSDPFGKSNGAGV